MQNEGRVWHQSGLHKTVLPYDLAVRINKYKSRSIGTTNDQLSIFIYQN